MGGWVDASGVGVGATARTPARRDQGLDQVLEQDLDQGLDQGLDQKLDQILHQVLSPGPGPWSQGAQGGPRGAISEAAPGAQGAHGPT